MNPDPCTVTKLACDVGTVRTHAAAVNVNVNVVYTLKQEVLRGRANYHFVSDLDLKRAFSRPQYRSTHMQQSVRQ